MKKLIFCLAFLLFMPVVKAGSYSISANSTSISVGQSVTVYVKVDGAAGKFSASSNNSGVLQFNDASPSVWIDNGSSSFKFIAKNAGSAIITISPQDVAGYDGNEITGSKSITISVKSPSRTTPTTPKRTEPTKSSNNYLKSYAIDGYKISPDFDKNKTDYTLTVPNGTTKVKILAYQESNKAKLSGDDGEVEVKEGENKLSTTVIAEDGSKKTYNINIIVESKPIIVKLNSQEYTLIKNKDELPNIDLEHEDMSLNFEGVDIPAYRIDKIGYILVGLKNNEGKIQLYKFDSYKNDEKEPTYELFSYLKINNLNLIILDFPTNKIPGDYKQYIEKIGDNDYTVYKLDKDSNYSLIYATNFDTGKNNIYKYEKSENTIQIYEKVAKKESVNNTEKYKKLILIMGIAIIILVLLTTIGFTKKPKIKKVKHEDKELTKKDIKKIEKSTKKENKKNKKRQRKGEPEL